MKKVLLLVLAQLLLFTACQPGEGAPPGAVRIGKKGGTVESQHARVKVAPNTVPAPLYVSIEDLAPDAPPPGPAIAPEVRPIAGARFHQTHPLPKEWQNFFLPQIALSLKRAVAPLKGGDYLTELCIWVPPQESDRVYGEWHCDPYFAILKGDPTQKGSGWAATVVKGFPKEGLVVYVFQYPREWARQNCEAAGGRFYTTGYGSFCSYVYDDERVYTFGQVYRNPLKARTGGSSPITEAIQLSGDGLSQLRTLTWNVGHTLDLSDGGFPSESCYYKLCKPQYTQFVGNTLKRVDPDIVHLQEVYVEDTRCSDHPNEGPCQDNVPLIEEILNRWKGPNWRDELDYVCKMYECTIIKKRTASGLRLEFVDKTDPTFTDYVTGVEGQDTGYLYAMLRVRHPDGEEQYLATFNEHTATPAKPGNARVRAEQFEKQREHILKLLTQGRSGGVALQSLPVPQETTILGTSPPGGYSGPRPDAVLKMGDFNLHLDPPASDLLPSELIPEPDDKSVTGLIAFVDPDVSPGSIFTGGDTAETAFSWKGPLLWRVGVNDYVSTYALDFSAVKWLQKTTDIVASNYFVGTCGISRDVGSKPFDGFDHNPVTCTLKPSQTRKFTGAAVRGDSTLRYSGGGLGPSVRVGTLFPNKGYGYRCQGRYCGTFFDLFASYPPTFNDDGTFTIEVPEHLLEAGLPIWVRYCVPTLGCKFVKLDPNNSELTISFNDDC